MPAGAYAAIRREAPADASAGHGAMVTPWSPCHVRQLEGQLGRDVQLASARYHAVGRYVHPGTVRVPKAAHRAIGVAEQRQGRRQETLGVASAVWPGGQEFTLRAIPPQDAVSTLNEHEDAAVRRDGKALHICPEEGFYAVQLRSEGAQQDAF